MRSYRIISSEKKTVTKIICNLCKNEIEENQHGYFADHLHIEKQWGYFSQKDGRFDTFDVCEACYDKLTNQFEIPVEGHFDLETDKDTKEQ